MKRPEILIKSTDLNDEIEGLIKSSWKTTSRGGELYYSSGPHSGKKVGTVRGTGSKKEAPKKTSSSKPAAEAPKIGPKQQDVQAIKTIQTALKFADSQIVKHTLQGASKQTIDGLKSYKAGLMKDISALHGKLNTEKQHIEQKIEFKKDDIVEFDNGHGEKQTGRVKALGDRQLAVETLDTGATYHINTSDATKVEQDKESPEAAEYSKKEEKRYSDKAKPKKKDSSKKSDFERGDTVEFSDGKKSVIGNVVSEKDGEVTIRTILGTELLVPSKKLKYIGLEKPKKDEKSSSKSKYVGLSNRTPTGQVKSNATFKITKPIEIERPTGEFDGSSGSLLRAKYVKMVIPAGSEIDSTLGSDYVRLPNSKERLEIKRVNAIQEDSFEEVPFKSNR